MLRSLKRRPSPILKKTIIQLSTNAGHGPFYKSPNSESSLNRSTSLSDPSAKKSWVPTNQDLLQRVTTQALIHEMSIQAMESAAEVTPWFLRNMPAAYFHQVPEILRKQHLKAVIALSDLKQSDLSLKIETKTEDNASNITFLSSQANKPGLLYSQLKDLAVPMGTILSKVHVFSSLDDQLALNVFSFKGVTTGKRDAAVTADKTATARIQSYVDILAAEAHNQAMPENASDIDTPKAHREAGLYVPTYSDAFSPRAMEEYFTRITPSYAQSSDPRRFLVEKELFDRVAGTDGTAVHIEPLVFHSTSHASHTADGMGGSAVIGASPVETGPKSTRAWITVAAANVLPEVLLRLTSSIIAANHIDIQRAHMETISDHEHSTEDMPAYVTMLNLLVSPDPTKHVPAEYMGLQHAVGREPSPSVSASASNPAPDFLDVLKRDLKRAKWLDDLTTDLGLRQHPWVGVEKAEVITALCSLLHGPLAKQDPQAYASIASIVQLISDKTMHMQYADSIATLFLDKFRPGAAISTDVFKKREGELREKIERLTNDSARVVLVKMLSAVTATLRTNVFHEDRYALSLRLDPSIMMPTPAPGVEPRPTPFGVIFVHGRHFNAFHNRFRDIARGGLRIVTPSNSDQYALESTRHYDEVYGLSYAQQLKNKDIPEGGAKAVLLVNTPNIAPSKKFFAMRKCVRAFTDAMLDLIVKDSVKNLVDLYGKDELIYLGPDEQIIPSDIDWICLRAAQRGYPIPAAFMSSKKGAGINHKEFGVTSEGVVVYLVTALKRVLNIDPAKQPFSVKITGGPDGDVAGNLIRILFRDYGSNCKIVGIADGFGVAEDPNGLDKDELLRLFHEARPITSFDKNKLSKDGMLMNVETEEGMARRNSMHFRVPADVFVPAGGRPNTINGDNWRQFIMPNGKPSSPLIVEGANIFTTPEARKRLFETAGVAIVKDSSANKCGVITSSCEVAASMLLSTEEFLGVKNELVHDVLDRLRVLAQLEAELLFREYKNYPGALPHFSERISYAIGKVTDALTDALADVQPEDPLFKELMPLVKENLPKKLADIAWDRVGSRFPVQYMRNAIASTLASKIVYQEGIHLVESQPSNRLAERAIMYYREDQRIRALTQELENPSDHTLDTLDPTKKQEIVKLLKKGGARAALDIF